MRKKIEWYIEFWDFGRWNISSQPPYQHKTEAILEAQRLNRKTTHETRKVFEGHRYRVRGYPKGEPDA